MYVPVDTESLREYSSVSSDADLLICAPSDEPELLISVSEIRGPVPADIFTRTCANWVHVELICDDFHVFKNALLQKFIEL